MANASKRRTGGRPKQNTVETAGLSEGQRRLLLLLLIVAIAAFLRLYQLPSLPPGLSSDEAMNGNDGLESIETGNFRVFYPQNGGREGLFINIQTAFVYVLGNKGWVLRLPSALFGILTVLALYFLARKLFSPAVGLLAAFFMATSFWHLVFSRTGLRAISSVFFLVWAIYLLLKALDLAREGKPYLGPMAWAGVVYGLGLHTYIAYRVTPVLIGLVLIDAFLNARKNGWMAALRNAVGVYAAVIVIVVAPLVWYFARNPESLFHRSVEVSVFHAPHPMAEIFWNIWKMVQMIFTKGDYGWLHNIAFRPAVFWPVAALFACGLGLAGVALYRRTGDWLAYALALLWLAVGSVPAVLSTENMPNSIRAILMIPPVAMLAAVGAWWAYQQLIRRVQPRLVQAAGAVLLIALCYEPYHSYFDIWASNFEVTQVFNLAGTDIAARINSMPKTARKTVVAVAPGLLTGLPPAAQTVMFLTGTYTKQRQEEANVHYIAREEGDREVGVAFCAEVAKRVQQGDIFCLDVHQVSIPRF